MLLSILKSIRRRPTASSDQHRKLHIGGEEATTGWEIFNADPNSRADHVGNAADLSRFADESFAEIYASHVLEHLDYKNELQAGLREWCRVLTKGGRLYVSVPDLDILARLLLEEGLTLQDRFDVMKMIFGGHINEYDYHKVGLNFDMLSYLLSEAGFSRIQRVAGFDLFDDTSKAVFAATPISLNVIAVKPD